MVYPQSVHGQNIVNHMPRDKGCRSTRCHPLGLYGDADATGGGEVVVRAVVVADGCTTFGFIFLQCGIVIVVVGTGEVS